MKKLKKKLIVFCVTVASAVMVTAVATTPVTNEFKALAATNNQTQVKTEKETLPVNKGKKNKAKKEKTVKLKTKKGKTYCKISGKIVKNQLVTIKKKTYLFDKKGVMVTGWAKYKKDYYYFGRSNGKMAKKSTVDGIKLDKSGKAKQTSLNVSKIKTMIRARKQLNSICKYTDTKQQKLRKCFDWIAKRPYKRYRFLKKMYRQKGWEPTFADDIFIHGDGCCVSESAALAFLVHEAGYKNVYVAHDSEHAWMELNGKVYDALFARSKDYKKYYNLSYGNYNCHPVDKRKI